MRRNFCKDYVASVIQDNIHSTNMKWFLVSVREFIIFYMLFLGVGQNELNSNLAVFPVSICTKSMFDRSNGFFSVFFSRSSNLYLLVKEGSTVNHFDNSLDSLNPLSTCSDISSFSETGQDPDVTVRLRRKFGGPDANSFQWHFRYMGRQNLMFTVLLLYGSPLIH